MQAPGVGVHVHCFLVEFNALPALGITAPQDRLGESGHQIWSKDNHQQDHLKLISAELSGRPVVPATQGEYQEDPLSPGVKNQPGKHSKTPITEEKERKGQTRAEK